MANGAGRKKKPAYKPADFDDAIDALKARIEKLVAIKAGMKVVKLDALPVDYVQSMKKGLDDISDFCDSALKELRKYADRGERPWDKWDD